MKGRGGRRVGRGQQKKPQLSAVTPSVLQGCLREKNMTKEKISGVERKEGFLRVWDTTSVM
jgi:hypothetical protein